MKKISGLKGWVFAVVFGFLSMGPVYMWYPLVEELKKQGLRYGLIAVFLYNRAIKIPFIPLMIFYFGVRYVFILFFVMIFMSLIQGVLIEKLMSKNAKAEKT
jgi:uncharacterized membrane protein YraQ (UPF0718 family)